MPVGIFGYQLITILRCLPKISLEYFLYRRFYMCTIISGNIQNFSIFVLFGFRLILVVFCVIMEQKKSALLWLIFARDNSSSPVWNSSGYVLFTSERAKNRLFTK